MNEKQRHLFSDNSSSDVIEASSHKPGSVHPSAKVKNNFRLFVDGASRGNPGPSGIGIYACDSDKKTLIKKGFYCGTKTNNQAEYLALLLGIVILRKKIEINQPFGSSLIVTSDSELLIKQMRGEYSVKNPILVLLKKLVDAHVEALSDRLTIKFTHVLRAENTTADALANEGIDKKQKLPVSFVTYLKKHTITV